MREIIIEKNDAGQRLDKFLFKRFPTLPKSMAYMYIRKKCIKVNGKKPDIEQKLKQGDVIRLYIKDEFFNAPKNQPHYDFLKAPKSLNIVYEDENLIIIDKPQGLIVHPDSNYHFDSLVSRLKHYLYDKGEYDPKQEQSFAPALANRIDRNTGGLVIGAKNAEALRELNLKIKQREIQKLYLCIAHGRFKSNEGTLVSYMTKNEKKNKVTLSDKPSTGAKQAVTKYRVMKSVEFVEEFKDTSVLEIELITGRTHQIRAQLAQIGHPLCGDIKYGKHENQKTEFKYQALYSYALKLKETERENILSYLEGREFKLDCLYLAMKDGILGLHL